MEIRHLKARAEAKGWHTFAAWLLRHLGESPEVVWRQVPDWTWLLFWLDEELTRSRRPVPARLRAALAAVAEHAGTQGSPLMNDLAVHAAEFRDGAAGGAGKALAGAQHCERKCDMSRKLARGTDDARRAERWWAVRCWWEACGGESPGGWLAVGAGHMDDSGLKPASRVAFRDRVVAACPEPVSVGAGAGAA